MKLHQLIQEFLGETDTETPLCF